jgi:hypothetical protein
VEGISADELALRLDPPLRARRRLYSRGGTGQRALGACERTLHLAQGPGDGRAQPRELASVARAAMGGRFSARLRVDGRDSARDSYCMATHTAVHVPARSPVP